MKRRYSREQYRSIDPSPREAQRLARDRSIAQNLPRIVPYQIPWGPDLSAFPQ